MRSTLLCIGLFVSLLGVWGCGVDTDRTQATGAATTVEKSKVNEDSDSHVTAAKAALLAGDYNKAVQEATASIAAHAGNAEAYSVRGMAEALQRDTDKGLQDTRKAYDLDSDNVANYYNMAMVYKLQGRLNESKEWFERVLEKDPRNTWSVYGIATIYADQGNDVKALDWLEQAIKIDPSVKAVAAEQDHFMKYHGQPRFEALIK